MNFAKKTDLVFDVNFQSFFQNHVKCTNSLI